MMSGSTVFTPVISPASYEDMGTIARLQFEAFLPSMAIERIIWPHGMTPDVLSSATEAKKHTFHQPHVRYVKITTTTDRQIVAFARWYIWTEDRPISDWQKAFSFQPDTTIASENLNVKAARLVYGMADELKKEIIRGSKCACKWKDLPYQVYRKILKMPPQISPFWLPIRQAKGKGVAQVW